MKYFSCTHKLLCIISVLLVALPTNAVALRPIASVNQASYNNQTREELLSDIADPRELLSAYDGVDKTLFKSSSAGAMPSYKQFKEMVSVSSRDKARMSARQFINQNFTGILKKALTDNSPVIVVRADHLDIDSFVSTLSMSYLLYQMLSLSGRGDISVVPMLYGSPKRIDRAIRFVADRVFGQDVFSKLPFSDVLPVGVSDTNIGFVQVDSSGPGNWLIIDHHKADQGVVSGPGSRIEKGPSAAFFVYQEYIDAGLKIDTTIAWITLYAILSDTINFTENMVGTEDIHEEINNIILPVISLPRGRIGAIFDDFSEAIFAIHGLSGADMLIDVKFDYIDGVAVAQKFFYDFDYFNVIIEDIIGQKRQLLIKGGLKYGIYMGTDVHTRKSYVFAVLPEKDNALKGKIDAVISRGAKKEFEISGVSVWSRPEMLRKQFMENTQLMFQQIALAGEAASDHDTISSEQEWFRTAHGIYRYAFDHRMESSSEDIIFSHYQGGLSGKEEFLTALKQLLLDRDKKIRTRASSILIRPEFFGIIVSSENPGFGAKSLLDVLALEEISDDAAYKILLDWYSNNIRNDKIKKELFFCHLQGIIMHEHNAGEKTFIRAVYMLNLLNNKNNGQRLSVTDNFRQINYAINAAA